MYPPVMNADATDSPAAVRPAECCSLVTAPLTEEEAENLAVRLRALSDPTRLRLLSHIAVRGCEPTCTCDLTEVLGVSQPTISHHAKRLVDAGLLVREQRGRWAHYSVVPEAFAQLRALLDIG